MKEKPQNINEKKFIVYKSVKDRMNIPIPSEFHRILKLEAAKQRRTIKELLLEAIKSYLKI